MTLAVIGAGVAVVALVAVILGSRMTRVGTPPPTAVSSMAQAAPGGRANLASPTTAATADRPAATGTPGSAGASPSPAASPAASPSADPILLGAGDIAVCDGKGDEATTALLEAAPGIVFTLGDNAYDDGSAAQLRDCYGPSWGRVLARTKLVATGNHDIRTDDGSPEAAYFGSAAVRDGVTWFSEDVGAWHVIVLDANCDHLNGGCAADSAQVRWLTADLAANTARCTLALWHQPRFSSGVHGNDRAVGPFWDALYAAGADLVLNGHDHDYERFAPQDPSGAADSTRGITELVVGTGGAPLRGFATTASNSVVRSSTAHGIVELTLHPTGWDFRFVPTDGSFGDGGSGTCH